MVDKVSLMCRFIVKRSVRKMFGRADEDAEQEIYLKLWQKYPSYREENKLGAWVRAVAENYCRDVLKSKSQKILARSVNDEESGLCDMAAKSNDPEREWLIKCRRRLILAAVDELPKDMRQAVVLVEFEGLSYEMAADKLKINVGTLKSRLFYAKKKLHEKLAYLEL